MQARARRKVHRIAQIYVPLELIASYWSLIQVAVDVGYLRLCAIVKLVVIEQALDALHGTRVEGIRSVTVTVSVAPLAFITVRSMNKVITQHYNDE